MSNPRARLGKFTGNPRFSGGSYTDEHDDRDRDYDRDRPRSRGNYSQRRVSFKTTNKQSRNIVSKSAALGIKIEDDEEMAESSGAMKNDKPRRRTGSPVPFKFRNTFGWYQVAIPYGHKYVKSSIIQILLDAMKPEIFIPLYWRTEATRIVFYVDDYKMAEKLSKLDKVIRMPDGFRLMVKVRSALPHVQINDELKARMKVAMSKRYNSTTKAIDLSKFHADEDLRGVFCGLLRPTVLHTAIDIMEENIPDVEALNLNSNYILQCEQFKYMSEKLKCIKILHLDWNAINSVQQLNYLKGLNLIELVIKNNPFSKHYRSEAVYVSEIRKKFPKLRKLDGQDLEPLIGFDVLDSTDLPEIKQSYIVDVRGIDVARQFVLQYFNVFDSNDRQPLAHAYHDDAMLSLSVSSSQPKLQNYLPFCRNLKSFDQKIKNRLPRIGKGAVLSFLIDLPKTQHDTESFTLDLTVYTPKLIAFGVTGIFREVNNNPTSEHLLRNFQRLFVIVPQGTGFCIVNELFLITSPTSAQSRSAFKSITSQQQQHSMPSTSFNSIETQSSTSNVAIDTTQNPNDSLKLQMVRTLAEQSKMNLVWSKRCLEENNWDFNGAINAFRILQEQNKVPPEAFIPQEMTFA